MNYQEWQKTIPSDITQDPLWKLEVYRLALFVSDISWQDAIVLSKNPLTQRGKVRKRCGSSWGERCRSTWTW